jgi:hypothetical protein
MRNRRQFQPIVDRLPYRITPSDITTLAYAVPCPSDPTPINPVLDLSQPPQLPMTTTAVLPTS